MKHYGENVDVPSNYSVFESQSNGNQKRFRLQTDGTFSHFVSHVGNVCKGSIEKRIK